jgi:hypothetical protein
MVALYGFGVSGNSKAVNPKQHNKTNNASDQ